MKRFASYVLIGLLAAGVLPLATAGPAGAIPAVPTHTAPADGVTVTSNPVLSWTAPAGATSYVVQASVNPSFSPLLVNKTTVNTKYGPEAELPVGVIYWRVAAKDGGGQSAFSDPWTFTKEAPSGPVLSEPADGATLHFPADPPVFSWEPFPGADRYEIEIDSDPSFIAPLTLNPTTTNNTSYTLTAPPTVAQSFYWRVRAFNAGNQPTQYSDVRSYSFDWPDKPVLLTPADDNSPSSAIEEVVFSWTPTEGAVSYELQVSPTDSFTTLTVSVATVKGTRYSPPETIDNGAYFWRVRARNTANAVGDWSEDSTFYRGWPAPDDPPNERVQLLEPADDDVSVGLPEFSWTPVRLASQYQLEVGDDPFFSPGSYSSCVTQHTSFIPVSSCDPDPGTDYYWRVKPIDGPAPINGLYSDTFRFQYDPGIPELVSPADGATGLVAPFELRWNPVSLDGGAEVAKYRVTILRNNGSTAETATTFATGYVPENLDPDQGPFRWYVQIVTESGDGNIPGAGLHRTFSFTDPTVFSSSPDPITPDGVSGIRMPNLEWEPVTGATSYEIWRATVPSNVYSLYVSGIGVAGYTDIGSHIPGDFTYFVRAKNGSVTLADGAFGSYSVETFADTNLTAPAHCPPNTPCAVESNTPTFQWQWDPDATHYRIYLASDPNFTNMLSGYNGVKVHYPRYRPTVSLPDAQAGQATYWYARPCYGTNPEVCGAEAGTFAGANPPVRAFTKRSNPVQLVAPAHQQPGDAPLPGNANQIVFSWVDYLATNLAAAGDLATDLEARNYRLQISTTQDMQTIVHTSPLVDQTTYTTYSTTLPDGPLYWRVQAYDASSNALSFSEIRLVHKQSPVVSLTTPTPGATVSRVPLFSWASQDYAARYTIEVYKNVGDPIAAGNRVLTVTTPMTAWIPTTSLAAGTYGWRVRRLDVDSRPGPWSAATNTELRLFTVAGNQVSLLTPADGANFPNNNQSFTWTAAPGAAQYRIQTSTSADFSTTKESIITVMTSWHSTVAYANGTYHWRVQTIDGAGNVTATSASRTFTHGPPPPAPPPTTYYHPLTPARILDSRAGSGVGAWSTKWGPNTTREVAVAGFSGVPTDADAVALNVTVTGTTGNSLLTIWPKGQPMPNASSLNWTAGKTIANAVTVKVGADEKVLVRNAVGSTHVIFDVVGYYDDDSATGGGLTPLTPKRIIDSRPGTQVGPYSTKWGPGVAREVTVTGGSTTVPSGADSVVLNVTVTGGTTGSFLTVWPDGEAQPTASSINFAAGQTIPNAVTTKVGTGGDIRIYNGAGSVNVIVDVVGYFDQGSGAPFRPLAAPVRIQDSRSSSQVGAYSTPWPADAARNVQVTGALANVPGTAVAALLNVTAVAPSTNGFLTVYPTGAAQPLASSLNWASGQIIPNSVTAKIGTSGQIRAYNAVGTVHVLMDISGYYGS
jgi:hypothetical protein